MLKHDKNALEKLEIKEGESFDDALDAMVDFLKENRDNIVSIDFKFGVNENCKGVKIN